jgi:hypothetical protein
MINNEQMREALDILRRAKNNLSHQDYVKIWGERLADHIWGQEGNDLLRLWRSGLTKEEADNFVDYILKKFKGDVE